MDGAPNVKGAGDALSTEKGSLGGGPVWNLNPTVSATGADGGDIVNGSVGRGPLGQGGGKETGCVPADGENENIEGSGATGERADAADPLNGLEAALDGGGANSGGLEK